MANTDLVDELVHGWRGTYTSLQWELRPRHACNRVGPAAGRGATPDRAGHSTRHSWIDEGLGGHLVLACPEVQRCCHVSWTGRQHGHVGCPVPHCHTMRVRRLRAEVLSALGRCRRPKHVQETGMLRLQLMRTGNRGHSCTMQQVPRWLRRRFLVLCPDHLSAGSSSVLYK
jgi:hypothetical protein